MAADFDFFAIPHFDPLFQLDWVCVPGLAFPPVDGYVPAVIPWLLNIHHLSPSLSLWPVLVMARVLLLRVAVIALPLLRVLVFQPLAVVVV